MTKQIQEMTYEEVIAQIEKSDAERAEKWPTTKDALEAIFEPWERLRALGWREGLYCPIDGSSFAAIEPPSTRICTAFCWGEFPKKRLNMGGFVHDRREIWWKPIANLTEDEEAMRQAADKSDEQRIEREFTTLAATLHAEQDDKKDSAK